ncbi:hypothetical protein EC07798_1836 [Escherichia coli 07798]|nr:hypothetical protein EC07798_1836 [Escherichia coli 07798]
MLVLKEKYTIPLPKTSNGILVISHLANNATAFIKNLFNIYPAFHKRMT